MAEGLHLPLREYNCKGKIHYNSQDIDVAFVLKQMQNGKLMGRIETSSELTELSKQFLTSNIASFSLRGTDDSGSIILVDSCYLTSLTIGTMPIVGDFIAFEAAQSPERLDETPKKKIVAVFDLLNVDETFRVKVGTRLGVLYLRTVKGYKDLLPFVKILKTPAVTAVAEIFIPDISASRSFREILADSTDVINGFLCISRLADTCYHDWCSVTILEETVEGSNQYLPIARKMSAPKAKTPSYRGLTNPAHSLTFYESAYSGYKGCEKELKKLYNFDVALEWYLEANIASVLESKYLMACTCLELLTDKYRKVSGTEFIMEQNVFEKDLYPVLHSSSRAIMKQLGLRAEQRKEIYMKMKGLNRESFRTGIESLLNSLRIKYDDLFDDIGEIIHARNAITHTGTYHDVKQLSSVFNRLYVLLTRMFLSILNYKQDYFDWYRKDWVKFSDVYY